ncbi:hypothetical protein QUF74_00365 [Candidatus Halobeggiatoa sp. HSG11]|nr:hypothetical protein [Candidatus Halobeggiatoa sp. HSG11]
MVVNVRWSIWLVLIVMSYLFVSSVQAGSTLSAGTEHVCGIKDDKTLICWGNNEHNQTQAPSGEFTQVGAGFYFNCGLKTDGNVVCWGRDNYGETSPPPGKFIQMDTGGYHACALSADGNPVCWGSNDSGQASPPSGVFTQLALGNSHSCGLTTDGNVKCWGDNSNEQSKDMADMTYITAGYQTTCGIKTDGTASCWGESNGSYGYLSQIDFSVYGGDRISPNIESFLFCGLRADYSVSCPSTTSTPSGKFTYVTVSADIRYYNPPGCCDSDAYSPIHSFACGIRENGLVACWGENYKERATAPVGIKMMQPEDFIPVSPPLTQEDLDDAYAIGIQEGIEEGKQVGIEICKSNPASCDIATNNDISAIIGQDLSLHVSKATYETLLDSSTIWVDLIFDGENEEGDLTWILDKYGAVE